MIFLLVPIFLSGCGGCGPKSQIYKEQQQVLDGQEYKISSQKIFAHHDTFSYDHVLSMIFVNERGRDVTIEQVSINGAHNRVHLKKKIDDNHFFEVFNENQKFFVKNRLGPWRHGSDNKQMYTEIIDDSFNVISWIIEQFSLKQLLVRHESSSDLKTIYILDAERVPADAPFLKNLAEKWQSKIIARLEVDKKSETPLYSRFSIELLDGDKKSIKLDAESKLVHNASVSDLKTPSAIEDGPLLYPVNIASRFNDLINLGQSDGK